MGQACGAIAENEAADLLVLDTEHPTLAGHGPDSLLDALVLTNAGSALREVRVAGRRVVEDGRHPGENAIRARYRETMTELVQEL